MRREVKHMLPPAVLEMIEALDRGGDASVVVNLIARLEVVSWEAAEAVARYWDAKKSQAEREASREANRIRRARAVSRSRARRLGLLREKKDR